MIDARRGDNDTTTGQPRNRELLPWSGAEGAKLLSPRIQILSVRHTAVLLALVATVSWGLWVLFAKLAGDTLTGEAIVVVTYFVGGSIGAGYVLFGNGSVSGSSGGLLYAVLGGLCFGVGGLAYYTALDEGQTVLPTTIAALYFVVASVLAVLVLGESLRIRDAVGIVLAVGAVALLST